MDAVEDLSRLDQPLGRSLAQFHQHVAARAVNAGEAQHIDRLARPFAQSAPLRLDDEPHAAAFIGRARFRAFVDPGAAVVAIDADGREIDDLFQARRRGDFGFEPPQHRIALRVGPGADEQRVGLEQGGAQALVDPVRSRRRRAGSVTPAEAPCGARFVPVTLSKRATAWAA